LSEVSSVKASRVPLETSFASVAALLAGVLPLLKRFSAVARLVSARAALTAACETQPETSALSEVERL